MRRVRNCAAAGRASMMVLASVLIGGCFDDGNTSSSSSNAPAVTSTTAPTADGSTPVVSNSVVLSLLGTPPTTAVVGKTYSFQPKVSSNSPDVVFQISGKPPWTEFNAITGTLTGTPAVGDQGTTGHIVISASDGTGTASMTPFTIKVAAPGETGAITLSWSAPTENSDGTPLTDLAGYKILYGTAPSELTNTIDVAGITSTSYDVTGLAAGTYYFAVVAYNASGLSSGISEVANGST